MYGLFGPAFEDEGAVGAAEAEGVRECVVDLYRLRLVGDVVETALRVELYDVHGGGGGLFGHRHDGEPGFEADDEAVAILVPGAGGVGGVVVAGGEGSHGGEACYA